MNSRSCLQKKAMKCSHCSFGMDNQQPELVNVPLDFFKEVLAYIDENVDSDSDEKTPVTVYGASKERNSHSTSQSSILRSTTSSSWHPGHGVSWACRNNTVRRCMLHGHSTEGSPLHDMSKGDLKIVANLFLTFFEQTDRLSTGI